MVRASRPERAHRSRRTDLQLDRSQGWTHDTERAGQELVDVLTVFLTGAECPFSCLFCDLWQHTTLSSTPVGAIPKQLKWLARELRERTPSLAVSVAKLYNASNFFDERAVPEADDGSIIDCVRALPLAPDARVVVECHPKILLSGKGRRRLERYAQELPLEVALGLESTAPGALETLLKGATVDEFRRAFDLVHAAGASVRAFVLYGIPGLDGKQAGSPATQRRWTLDTLRWARDQSARCAAVIPVRRGNGTLEELAVEGTWAPPSLIEVEAVFGEALGLQARSPPFDVHLDTWDLESIDPGDLDEVRAESVRSRLRALDATGIVETSKDGSV